MTSFCYLTCGLVWRRCLRCASFMPIFSGSTAKFKQLCARCCDKALEGMN